MQDNYSQNYEKITDEAKLNALLERIFDSHSLLSVTLSGEQAIFNSALISIDTNKNNIVIDELHPERGNDKLQPSCKINIFTGIQGVDISFQCKLLETGKQSGILYHVLSYPEHIKYYQRRKSYRVQVIRSLAVNATLTTPDGQTIKGELHNISSDIVVCPWRG